MQKAKRYVLITAITGTPLVKQRHTHGSDNWGSTLVGNDTIFASTKEIDDGNIECTGTGWVAWEVDVDTLAAETNWFRLQDMNYGNHDTENITIASRNNATPANYPKLVLYDQYDVTKTLDYAIKTETDISKGLEYKVSVKKEVTKTLTYEILSATTIEITRGLNYSILKNLDISKGLSYQVILENQIAKQLIYSLIFPVGLTKSLEYKVSLSSEITKQLNYKIVASHDITKSLTYRVIHSAEITKTLSYKLLVGSEITKTLQYAVIPSTDIQKALKYALVAPREAITKPMTYHLRIYPYCGEMSVYTPKPNKICN